jgi:predicted nucleic acid-binding protein
MVLDTDVVIRFLTNDDPDKARRFEEFIALGKKVYLTDVTFAEIYWTLRSFYKFDKEEILDALDSLINTSSIFSNYDLLEQTIEILKKHNISLIDAYNAAFALLKEKGGILSFDKDFDKVSGITRIEP